MACRAVVVAALLWSSVASQAQAADEPCECGHVTVIPYAGMRVPRNVKLGVVDAAFEVGYLTTRGGLESIDRRADG